MSTGKTKKSEEETDTCRIADSLLGMVIEHLPKVQSRNKQSRHVSEPFIVMYFRGNFLRQSELSLQSPVCNMLPNSPSNRNMTAPGEGESKWNPLNESNQRNNYTGIF